MYTFNKILLLLFAILVVVKCNCKKSTPSSYTPVAGVSILGVPTSKTAILGLGVSVRYQAVVSPKGADTTVIWKTDKDTVAVVTFDGLVKTLKLGTCDLIAVAAGKDKNGKAYTVADTLHLIITPSGQGTFISATVSNITETGFTLVLNPGVSGLVAADLAISDGVTIKNVSQGPNNQTYNVTTSTLTNGKSYTLTITKNDYVFNSPSFAYKSTGIGVTASVGSITATGFTLTLEPGVTGLSASDLAMNGGVTIQSITQGANNKIYTVTTTTLTNGTPYTLTITKSGYSFNSPIITYVTAPPAGGLKVNVRGWRTNHLAMGGIVNGGEHDKNTMISRPVDAAFTYAGIDGGGDRGVQIPIDKKVERIIPGEIRRDIEAPTNKKIMPCIVFYTVDGSSSHETIQKDLSDDYLANHYYNLISICKQLQGYKDATHTNPATLILNPDFLGEIHKSLGQWGEIPISTPVHVNQFLDSAFTYLNIPPPANLPKFDTNLKGYCQSINYLVRYFAPDVPFTWQVNVWAGDQSGHLWIHRAANGNSGALNQHVNNVIQFLKDMGVWGNTGVIPNPDFITFDKWERDVFDAGLNGAGVTIGYLYNAADMAIFLQYVYGVSKGLGDIPVMLWQIPGGHLQLKSGDVDTRGNHASTEPNYYLGDPNISDDLSNVQDYILNTGKTADFSLNYSFPKATNVQTYLNIAPNNPAGAWRTGHVADLVNANVFSILWGGGSTTSVNALSDALDDKGWLYDRIIKLGLGND